MSEAPVAVPGVARAGAPSAERRRIETGSIPDDACLLCGDRERLAPEPLTDALEFDDELDPEIELRRPAVLLCPTCAAAQRAATQRLWWLGVIAQLGAAAVVVTALILAPVHGLLVGGLLLLSLVASGALVDRLLRRARERAVPLAWLRRGRDAIELQFPSWDPRGARPARLRGVSARVPIFLTSLLAFVIGWLVWHEATPVLTLDNPSTGPCTFLVDGRAHSVPREGRAHVRLREGPVDLEVRCPGAAPLTARVDLEHRHLFSSRADVCYAERRGGFVKRGPVARVGEAALRLPCD